MPHCPAPGPPGRARTRAGGGRRAWALAAGSLWLSALASLPGPAGGSRAGRAQGRCQDRGSEVGLSASGVGKDAGGHREGWGAGGGGQGVCPRGMLCDCFPQALTGPERRRVAKETLHRPGSRRSAGLRAPPPTLGCQGASLAAGPRGPRAGRPSPAFCSLAPGLALLLSNGVGTAAPPASGCSQDPVGLLSGQ